MRDSDISNAIKSLRPSQDIEIIDGVINWFGADPISDNDIDNEISRLKNIALKNKADDDRKIEGVEFGGVMCSATGEDQMGLLAVKNYVKSQDKPTTFFFANGNALVVTPVNIDEFEQVWGEFRASFFNES